MNLANGTITQLLIPIDDFERGVAFYRDVLGIPLLFSAPPQMAFFQSGAVRLLVGVMPFSEKGKGVHRYFDVKDIQAVYAFGWSGTQIQGATACPESIRRNQKSGWRNLLIPMGINWR